MVIVTAANDLYFQGLANLVGSIHYWAPECKVLVYDLGLNDLNKQEVTNWTNTVLVTNFFAVNAPVHCKKILTYCWKPLALYNAIEKNSSILWLDAGCDLRAPINPIQRQLKRDGYFFVQGQDTDMTLTSHPDCYKALNTKQENFIGKEHYAGGLQGYVKDSDAHKIILNLFYEFAQIESCIAPGGSDSGNHRFDQTLLSILIYQSGLSVKAHTHLLSAHREELNVDPMKPSDRIVFTARCTSQEYVDKLTYSVKPKDGYVYRCRKCV